MTLGAGATRSVGLPPVVGVVLPLLIRAVGVVASILGVLAVRARRGQSPTLALHLVSLSASGSKLPLIRTIEQEERFLALPGANTGRDRAR